MSPRGKHIYMVVKADEKDLKRWAEKTQFNLQLAIGVTDLTSIEPCDEYWYPLRRCVTQDKAIIRLKEQLQLYFYIADGNLDGSIEELRRDMYETGSYEPPPI